MTTINATLFKALINDSGLSAINAEYIIDMGIDRLNTYGAGISNLSGGVGTKELVATSAQAGAILEAARIIYWGFYKGQEIVAIAGLSKTPPNMLSNPVIESQIKRLAEQFRTRTLLRT